MKTLSPQVRHVIFGQWVALGLLMVTCLILYVQFYRQQGCMEDYMAKDHQTTATRVQAADTERESLKQVFTTIVSGDRQRVGVEIRRHAALLERNDEIRAKNPQPELPQTCA